jgi:hypothetical protein
MPAVHSPEVSPINYGIALQLLSNAAEHLVTDRVYSEDSVVIPAEDEAIRILSRRSREVFDEYSEMLGRRRSGGSRWFDGRAAGAVDPTFR